MFSPVTTRTITTITTITSITTTTTPPNFYHKERPNMSNIVFSTLEVYGGCLLSV